ncbi:MAG: hypothetical protein KDG50_02405 [Chromatiales bacterium]|nr:hypothetical protein [Chromatiales bacterium]
MIGILFDLLKELSASFAFRISQRFHLSSQPKLTIFIQFLVFAFVLITIFAGLITGITWLLAK